ncbi:hypothetical protein B296_00032967, partial [Ensete ventricosum]
FRPWTSARCPFISELNEVTSGHVVDTEELGDVDVAGALPNAGEPYLQLTDPPLGPGPGQAGREQGDLLRREGGKPPSRRRSVQIRGGDGRPPWGSARGTAGETNSRTKKRRLLFRQKLKRLKHVSRREATCVPDTCGPVHDGPKCLHRSPKPRPIK